MIEEPLAALDTEMRAPTENEGGPTIVVGLPPPSTTPARRWPPVITLPSISIHSSERKLLLLFVDIVLLVAALIIAVRARTDWMDTPGASLALWHWYATLAVVWWFVAQLLEAYDLARAASAAHSILSAGSAAALTALIYQMIPYFTPPLASRGLSVLFTLLAVAFIALWRGLYAILFVQPNFHQRALVLGAGVAGQVLVDTLKPPPDPAGAPMTLNPYHGTGYTIIGFVDDDEAKLAAGQVCGIPVIGPCSELPKLARELAIDEVVLAITHQHVMSDCAFDALITCREQGINVTTMPVLYERLLGRVPVEHVGRNLNAVLPVDDRGPAERIYWFLKRASDILIATLGTIPLAIVIPFVALANALFCPGPLFYRQTRVGKAGRLFEVIKFRTMLPDAERTSGAVWAATNDSRVTSVGRLLRKARLDEVPQLVNVLHGEMSLIGPRPERPEFVDQLAQEIPFYRARHAVRPGLTGWAQVRYGYGNSVADSQTKLEYDLYFVRHAGFYLDALIVLKTVGVVLRLQGK